MIENDKITLKTFWHFMCLRTNLVIAKVYSNLLKLILKIFEDNSLINNWMCSKKTRNVSRKTRGSIVKLNFPWKSIEFCMPCNMYKAHNTIRCNLVIKCCFFWKQIHLVYPRGYFFMISKEQLVKTLSIPFDSRPMEGYWKMLLWKMFCLFEKSMGYKVPCPMCHGGKFALKITKSYLRAAWLHQADEAWNNTRSSSISPNLEFWHFCVPPISHLAMMNATQIYCFPLKKECNFKDTFLFPLFSWPCSDEWRLWKKVN